MAKVEQRHRDAARRMWCDAGTTDQQWEDGYAAGLAAGEQAGREAARREADTDDAEMRGVGCDGYSGPAEDYSAEPGDTEGRDV